MASGTERFQNNFDFLRLFAALTVIFSHSYALLGLNQTEPFLLSTGIITLGASGVGIFFVISGYLITKSWERDAHAFIYFKKRILRIFPGLIVVTLLTVFVLGPCVSTLSLGNYFTNPQTWNYLKTMFLLPNSGQLPGVFADNPYSPAVNGSLWTLPYEFLMYIMVFALGVLGLIKTRLTIIPLYFLAILVLPVVTVHPIPILSSLAVFLGINFVAGMVLYLYRDKIRLDYRIALLFLFVLVLSFHTAYALYVTSIALPYLVVYFAFVKISSLHNIGKYGDFSYGLYIYAFPIQQTIVYFFADHLTPTLLFGLSAVTTFPVAVLSWFLIESPALKLKERAVTKRRARQLPSDAPHTDITGPKKTSDERDG